MKKKTDEKTNIAVFDFDGTILNGQSPVLLVLALYTEGIMPFSTAIRIGFWGLRYKIDLPHNEYIPRQLIFKALRFMPKAEADAFLVQTFREHIEQKIFKESVQEIEKHKQAGHDVVILSASFDIITKCVVEDLGLSGQISTQMDSKNGVYTGKLASPPVEGLEKVRRFKEFANERYGEDNWMIHSAYGDHISDIPILSMAENPKIVNPTKKLRRIARQDGIETIHWSK